MNNNNSNTPLAVTELIADQDLRITSAQSVDALAKSSVTFCPNLPQGVRSVNWRTGAEAAMALWEENGKGFVST